MIQTLALLIDGYRELNARRLFWVSLAVSALVVAIFGVIGIRGETVTLLGWETPLKFVYLSLISPATFYKLLFLRLGITFWLSLFATILALVSTSGMFPDFLAGGSIDLYLSKPISRLRLFFTKYFAGLFFVTLQVTAFCLASFLVLGFRGGAWEPAIFVAIPLVVVMFSYLFAVCVLLGIFTRSTVASLILTIIFWGMLWAVHQTDVLLLRASMFDQRQVASIDKKIADLEDAIAHPTSRPTTQIAGDPNAPFWKRAWDGMSKTFTASSSQDQLSDLKQERARLVDRFATPHKYAFLAASILPKTSETIGLLERELISRAELPSIEDEQAAAASRGRGGFRGRGAENRIVMREVDAKLKERSALWVLGTSVVFEIVILGWAAWIFCRRDF